MTDTDTAPAGEFPQYQPLPPLSPEEYAALRDSIETYGVLVPVDVDENGSILDGHHRSRICGELGITPPVTVHAGLTEDQKRDYALRVDLTRRHLTSAQKRDLIRAELDRDPSRSDREIGRLCGVDHKTVGAVRAGLSGVAARLAELRAAASMGDDLYAAGVMDRLGLTDMSLWPYARFHLDYLIFGLRGIDFESRWWRDHVCEHLRAMAAIVKAADTTDVFQLVLRFEAGRAFNRFDAVYGPGTAEAMLADQQVMDQLCAEVSAAAITTEGPTP